MLTCTYSKKRLFSYLASAFKEEENIASLHGVEVLFNWEPLWQLCPWLTWATKVSEAYTGETDKPCANEWAAKGLFDFKGEATKALFVYSK